MTLLAQLQTRGSRCARALRRSGLRRQQAFAVTNVSPERFPRYAVPQCLITRPVTNDSAFGANKYANATAERASRLDPEEVHKAGEEQLDRVEKALRGMAVHNEVFTVRREGLHVYADLDDTVGTYWVQYSKELQMVCFVSPRSGAYRYIWDKPTKKWIGELDQHDLEGMLTRDLIQQAYGMPEF